MPRDPVCGMNVDPKQAAAFVEHLGDTYYFCGKGCARKFSAHPEHYSPQTSPGATPAAPKPSKTTVLPVFSSQPLIKDPVCGMDVDPAKSAASRRHDGKAYYFCSTLCAECFEKEPQGFLSAPATAAVKSESAAPSAQAASNDTTASY